MPKEFDYSQLDRAAKDLGCRWTENAPLAPLTTFKIGGPADRLIQVENAGQLSGILREARGLPLLILGKGSNLLVSDRGFRGAAVSLTGDFRRVELLPSGAALRAGAGAPLASACAFARDRSLSGLEFAWGIPGSVGGGVFMNAGAYGGEMKDVVVRVRHMDRDGTPGEAAGEALDFSYRHSCYSSGEKVILSADLRLAPGSEAEISGKMEDLMARRKAKQPYDIPSAGSTFKRPAEGYAAALIEECGLKGRRVGGAQVSEKHAGFVINTGGATCEDVLRLMEIVRETVLRTTGIALEPEIRIIGE